MIIYKDLITISTFFNKLGQDDTIYPNFSIKEEVKGKTTLINRIKQWYNGK